MKPLARAKERLAGMLDPDQRRRLSLAMLDDVVRAARGFDAVWVLQSDLAAAAVARDAGAEARPDPTPAGGLNASLDAATAAAVRAGFEGILIVSADLPAARAEDLGAIAGGPGVALAPDHAGTGTNALWRAPGDVIPVAFGEASRIAHERLATAAGVPFRMVARSGLAWDVDRPEDLTAPGPERPGRATRAVLAELGIA